MGLPYRRDLQDGSIEQIFPFENHGAEIGVSLAHPHGQVYCYPFIAPKMEKELQHTEAYHEKTGGNLLKDIMNAELEAGERIVMRNHSWVATGSTDGELQCGQHDGVLPRVLGNSWSS